MRSSAALRRRLLLEGSGMNNRLWIAVFAVAVMAALVSSAKAEGKADVTVTKKGDNLVEVTAIGQGMSKEAAELDAKRKAIEYGAGADIFSHSEVKDYALVKDSVISRAAGFLQGYEVLSCKEDDDGVFNVKIRATVSVKGIEDVWGAVQVLLKEKGRPKIMVFVSEKVDGVPAELSTVQTKIEGLLLKSGFALVDQKQMKEIDKKDLAAAVSEDKPDRAQAIAKRFGAQLFITGSVDTVIGEAKHVQGVPIYTYGAKGNIRSFQTDDGKLLASENANEMSADRMKNVAGDKALAALGDKIGPVVQWDILRLWQDAFTGGGEVSLKVENVTFRQKRELVKLLKTIKGVQEVNEDQYANNVVELKIQTTLSAKTLANTIDETLGETLEVTDVTANVIKAAMKAKKE